MKVYPEAGTKVWERTKLKESLDARKCAEGSRTQKSGESGLTAPCCSCNGLDRIVLAEPLFDHFLLSGQHDSLPAHRASALAVLGHDVRTLIEYLDQAFSLGSLEVVRRESCMVFLHVLPV